MEKWYRAWFHIAYEILRTDIVFPEDGYKLGEGKYQEGFNHGKMIALASIAHNIREMEEAMEE